MSLASFQTAPPRTKMLQEQAKRESPEGRSISSRSNSFLRHAASRKSTIRRSRIAASSCAPLLSKSAVGISEVGT